eukprot:CAMPEP_0185728194 /NCGR_PEP_ID=MMETSP1171-20130828/3631_1 /TAXON_ID=374046 /ORGANISM="Helicotheca tamensis, Strain CCMP826" /LENGTH=363 /DNA_ID=CAMNT_0028396873 /DNA_START=22 /DNA_END=1109 /DNA_ORIENTATION=+
MHRLTIILSVLSTIATPIASFSPLPHKTKTTTKHKPSPSSSFGLIHYDGVTALSYSTDSEHDIINTQKRLSNLLDGAISLYSLHSSYSDESNDGNQDETTKKSIEELIDATASALHATFEMQRLIEIQNLGQTLDDAVMQAATETKEEKEKLVEEVTKLAEAYHANSVSQQQSLSIPMLSPSSTMDRMSNDVLETRLEELTRVINPEIVAATTADMETVAAEEVAGTMETTNEEKRKVAPPEQSTKFSDFSTDIPESELLSMTKEVAAAASEEVEAVVADEVSEGEKTVMNDEDAQKLFEEIMGQVTESSNSNSNAFESLEEQSEEEKMLEEANARVQQQQQQQTRFNSFSWIGDLMGGGGGG